MPSVLITVAGSAFSCDLSPGDVDKQASIVGTQAQDYLTNPGQQSGNVIFNEAAPIPDLLKAIGIALPAVSQVVLTSPVGSPGTSTLSWDDLNNSDTVFAQGLPPVLYETSQGFIGYARQIRNAPNDPSNIIDDTTTSSDEILTMVVSTGPVETVTMTASSTTPKIGASVTFTATASSKIVSPQYSWTFGDGAATKPTGAPGASHAFTADGSVKVSVSVTGVGGFNGSATVTLDVGKKAPPKSTKPKPGTGTSTKKSAPSTGPNSGIGTRAGASPSPTPGVGGAITKGAQSTTSGTPSQNQLNAQAAIDALPLVSGRLIGGITRTISATSLGAPQTATAPAARIPPKWRLPLSAGAALVVILLLVGGATSEVRPNRRRRRLE